MANTKTSSKPKQGQEYPKDLLMHWYEEMLLQRRFEERCRQVYMMEQKIKGFLHLYIGQEAVSSGIEAAIRKDDALITAYRDHGVAITRGVSPEAVMAEMYGKVGGSSKGKGGSMHMFSKEHGLYGGHGIVGGQIPLGAGIAFGFKYQDTDRLCVCMMGDGATRQGALHEAFNLAMLWNLPVIFVIENNKYSMGTSVERTSNVHELWKLGLSYEMPAWPVDAMNVFTVYEEMKKAVAHVRAGKGPVLLEMNTYRYQGHSMSDPGKYRTKEEMAAYKDLDPVMHLQSHLIENKICSSEDLDTIEARVMAKVQASVEFAEASPFPSPEELFEDVYAEPNYPFIKE